MTYNNRFIIFLRFLRIVSASISSAFMNRYLIIQIDYRVSCEALISQKLGQINTEIKKKYARLVIISLISHCVQLN